MRFTKNKQCTFSVGIRPIGQAGSLALRSWISTCLFRVSVVAPCLVLVWLGITRQYLVLPIRAPFSQSKIVQPNQFIEPSSGGDPVGRVLRMVQDATFVAFITTLVGNAKRLELS